MSVSFMCGLAKLKRKKIPNLLLGICIAITGALLVNVLVLLRELDGIFDRAYEEMEGTQMCCLWSKEIFSADDIRQCLDSSGEAFVYQITENTKTIDYVEKDGVKLSNGILLELPETLNHAMLSPKIFEQSEIEMPKKDEIWITAKMANILCLKVGDDIFLQLADQSVKVKVAKIVVDSVFGGSNTNVYRMWCGYHQLSQFPLADNNRVSYLEIRFQKYSPKAEQNFIHHAEEYFDMPLGDIFYTYEKIKNGYTSMYRMMGAALCVVSAVLAVTIILLTLFLIKSDMDEDVKNIGIYKSLGMTGAQIVNSYLVSYGTVGFTGALLGSLLGGWLNQRMITGILREIGIHTVSFAGCSGYPFVCMVCCVTAVILICYFSVFKVQKLNASYAIRKGIWQTKETVKKEHKGTHNSIRSSFELFYAIRGMGNKKIRYAYLAGISLVLGCLTVLCLGCIHAVENIDREPETRGFIKSDIYATSLGDMPVSTVASELEKAPEVDYLYGVNKVYVEYKPDAKADKQSIPAELYELPWNEKIEDKSLYGRRPLKENEIALGLAFADAHGLTVGEKIELFVKGEKREYEVTGIFQTLSNYGNIVRMVTEDLDRFVEADGNSGDYMLVLSKGRDKWEYAEKLNEKYNGKFTFIVSKSNGENITGILVPAVGIILSVLFGVSILVTINLTFLLVRREQNFIGLLKAVGMTSRQVLKIYLWRNCLAALVGNSLGMALGIFLMPGLLTPFAKTLGLTEFPFANSLTGTLISFLLLPTCTFLGTCAIIKLIGAVSVKQLVSE